MRSSRRLPTVTLVLGLCSTVALAAVSPGRAAPVTVGTHDADALYADWRWIGLLQRSQRICPTPTSGNWTTQTLFAVEPPPEDAPPSTEEAPLLHEFCAYESTAENPARPKFQDESVFVSLDRDFMGVMPSGDLIEKAYATELAAHFASQTGDVALPTLPNKPQVRLAIVDTAATHEVGAEKFRGTSEHGFTLLNLVKSLVCDGNGGCVAKVTSRLALGWKCFETDTLDASCRDAVDGGRYGLPSEVASAINSEVQAWRAGPAMKLVVNLSVGWDPALGGLEFPDDKIPAPALAVRTALEHAVCEGALVIAAAGNRTGGPTAEVGPLLPAAWETRAAPTKERCVALGVATDDHNFPDAGESPYRPLVFAVGGVRADGGRLFNSRTAAEPRLVAFGDHAKGLAPGAKGSGWTGTLTGTSVSAAVVSAAAAAAWYYDDDLKPYDVPKTASQEGTSVGRDADVCLGGSPCPPITVKRISVCGAAVAAGGVDASLCPPPQPIDPSKVDLTAVTFLHQVSAIDLLHTTGPIGACQGERLSYETAPPTDPCPHWQYYPRVPQGKAEPQPGPEGICTVCTYDPELGMASLEIHSGFRGVVSSGILTCGDATFSLDLPPMKAGDTAQVSDVVCAASPIQFSFTVDGDKSVTSPVLDTGSSQP